MVLGGGDEGEKKKIATAAAVTVPVKSSPVAETDLPAKKLARQLDFAATATAAVTSTSGVMVRAHQGVHSHSQAFPVALPPPSAAVQIHSKLMAHNQPLPSPSSVVVMPPMPLQMPRTSLRVMSSESPKARKQPNVEAKNGTPKKQKQCNCKHSQCLKLYCECFASGVYCDGCNCVNCCNNVENEAARRDAVEATLERNPNAFRPKIANSPHGHQASREAAGVALRRHNRGCHCKKSGCLKKYCECFQANILCSENCKCVECKNFEGSEERQALFHGDHTNSIVCVQQAANTAITGAVGSSGFSPLPFSKKRKGNEVILGTTIKDMSMPSHQEGINAKPAATSTSVPSAAAVPAVNSSALSTSKSTYRSLLADIIQPQDAKELCSVLVVLSEEVTKTYTKNMNALEKQAGEQDTLLASSSHDRENGLKDLNGKAVADYCSVSKKNDKLDSKDSNPDEDDGSKVRPLSPGTLSLMCDEEDITPMTAGSPNKIASHVLPPPSQVVEQGITEAYVEQERMVLTKFRDCLKRLITFGEIKETTKLNSLARSDSGDKKEAICNGSENIGAENGTPHAPVTIGAAKSVVSASKKLIQ